MMDSTKTTLERAFELARSGQYRSVGAIQEQLRHEGYAHQQIMGALLRKQLRGIIKKATADADLAADASGSRRGP